MGRTIITKADVEKESSEGLERLEVAGDEVETAIALGLAPIKSSPPSKRAVSPDAYLDRLVKYIPSEVIATYLSLDLICRSAIEMWPGWLVLGFGCLATPVYLSKISEVRKPVQLLVSTLAFCVWVFALGGPFLRLSWYKPLYGALLLPMPYFPGPAAVLRSLISDRALLLDSTWHSLALLLSGYTVGVLVGLISGICIGWSSPVRYWGMPILKIVGPIPATAWIPLAMVVSPSAIVSAAALIALAVWFPVTMLTASGISNTRASYLDVARTLGAGRGYLIFRVAIPAAIPNIFIGLFMGLGASFLTLVVAETVGVKSGLGWYVSWAQGWAEYGKVFAALVIMAAFFSTIMTMLFKVRDRVLVWQKGVIKW